MPEDRMRCTIEDEDLSALVDGELPSARADELRLHATGCARCAERVAAFERAGALLSALPSRPVPTDLRARLQARIEADTGSAPGPTLRKRAAPPPRRRWLASPALATAAALAAAVALYWALTPGEPLGGESELPPIAREEPRPAPTPTPAPLEPEPSVAPELEAPRIAEAPVPEASPRAASDVEFDPVPAEEIALALELETIEDLDVIANLELLEALVALSEGTG